MNCVVFNLREQNIRLSHITWLKMKDFYTANLEMSSTNLTLQCAFQILFIFSKLNAAELYASKYGSHYENLDAAYDSYLSLVLNTLRSWKPDSVSLADHDSRFKIKQFLKSSVIRESLFDCLNFVLDDVKFDDLEEPLDKINVYFAETMYPLRGICLMDGILISKLAFDMLIPEISEACLLTLVAHETCHYLTRFIKDDYNFSSPLKYNGDGAAVFVDSEVKNKNLELGRMIEMKLFDGIQPDWKLSTDGAAAKTFLERIKTKETPPLIKQSEYSELKLIEKKIPSLSFAADIELCCIELN